MSEGVGIVGKANKRILCSVLVLCMCVCSVTLMADSSDTVEKVFDATPGGTLNVDTDLGSITIRTGRSDEVRITVTKIYPSSDRDVIEDILNDLEINMDADDNGVTIDTKYRRRVRWSFFSSRSWQDRLRLRYEITVPQTYNIDLRTSDDDITIAKLRGTVRSVTSDGNIFIYDIDGPVTAKTSDGNIEVSRVTGNVNASTSDGNIDVETAGGEIKGSTSDGNIHVSDASGPVTAKTSDGDIIIDSTDGSVNCTTSDGDIVATIISQPKDDSRLRSSDGDISITIKNDMAFSIDAHTSDGRVDFGDMEVSLGKVNKHTLIADINGGGPELDIRTSDGDITIKAK